MEFFGDNFKEFIRIGELTIQMYAVCIMCGILLGAVLAIKEGNKLGFKKDTLLDGILICVPLAIIGARLFYVIFEWEKIIRLGFWNIFNIAGGGMAITGSIIVAFIFVIVYGKKKNINPLKIFDIVAPGLLVGQILGRWGNFFNQEAYGGKVSNVEFLYHIFPDWIIDRMFIRDDLFPQGAYRHPTFLYESLWNLVGLVIILIARRKFKKAQIGDFIGFYLIWYGFGRSVLIEPYRTDALLMFGLRINIIIPALMCVGGIIYLIVKHIKYPQITYIEAIEEGTRINEERANSPELVEETEKKGLFLSIKEKIANLLEEKEEINKENPDDIDKETIAEYIRLDEERKLLEKEEKNEN